MRLSPSTAAARRSGFTLIELMVAIGVTALLVTLMLSITVNVMGGWNRSSGSLAAGNQARMVLDMISKDLQAAIIKQDSNVWFAASIQQNQQGKGDSGVLGADWKPVGKAKPSGTLFASTVAQTADPLAIGEVSLVLPYASATASPPVIPALDNYRFGQAGMWLRFFTSVADTNKDSKTAAGTETYRYQSGPRAVAYQIIRLPVVYDSTPSKDTEYRYQLFRSEVSSKYTFKTGYDLFAADYNRNTETSVSGTEGLKDRAGILRHPEVASHDRSFVIANNVIDFGIRVYTRKYNPTSQTNELVLTYPVVGSPATKLGFAATIPSSAKPTPLPEISPASAAVDFEYGVPAAVEVCVRILTDEGVLQIENLEKGIITGNWWEIALKNSNVYSRRIEINANGF